MGAVFLLVLITVSRTTKNVGGGFLLPGTGKLGARHNRFDFTEIVYGITYSYGITDYVEVEMGQVAFMTGNLGFRFHIPESFKAHDFSLDVRLLLFPGFTYDDGTFMLVGGMCIFSYSFSSGIFTGTVDVGYGGVPGLGSGLLLGSALRIKSSKRTEFMAEAGWFTAENDLSILGLIMGPRVHTKYVVFDFGLLFPLFGQYEDWPFLVLPVLNMHVIF